MKQEKNEAWIAFYGTLAIASNTENRYIFTLLMLIALFWFRKYWLLRNNG